MEQDDNEKVNVDRNFERGDVCVLILLRMTEDLIDHEHSVPDHRRHVQGEKEEEEQEVPVILVAQAIVHECAVMIEALDALVAVVAVHRVLGPEILAVNADVIEM